MQTSRAEHERPECGTTPAVTHVSEDEPVSLAVVEAVAAASGRPPLCDGTADDSIGIDPLDPLNDAIDPDALDAIWQQGTGGASSAPTVSFRYCGYEVTVEGTEQITVVEA